VVDTGDVVAHLLTRSLRTYYDLDGLWADARAVGLARAADGADDAGEARPDEGSGAVPTEEAKS
jgi:hypothetical protein